MKKAFLFIHVFLLLIFSSSAQLSPNGLHFDGINDQVIMSSPPAFDVYAGDFTIEAFIRDESNVTSGPSEEVILSNESTNPNSPGFRLSILWGSLTFMINGNGTGFQLNGDLRDHQCHHVAVVRSNGTVTGYVDGEIATSWYIPDSLHSFFPLRLGARGPINGPFTGFFNGMIKEVRLWNSARTWTEITNNKMSVLNVALSPSLVGYWRCNEGSGASINDYSSGFNSGMLGEWSTPGSQPTWATGCTSCIPQPVITSAGPTTFCSGGQVLLQTGPGAGYYSYQWKRNGINLPNWWSPDNPVSVSGNYAVEVYGPCGTTLSPSVQVTVQSLPAAGITNTGSTTICQGGSVTLNAPVSANRSYQWKKNGVVIPGATSSAYVATSGGTYKATVTNTNTGCSKTSGTGTTVTVNPNPTVSVTPQGSTTFCLGDSVQLKASYHSSWLYQWKKNNTNINGATSNKIYAKTAGNYKVKVTNVNGCTTISSAIVVNVPCRENETVLEDPNFNVEVYPNPSSGGFTIKFSNIPSSPVQIELTDETGRVVKRFETDDETIVVNELNLTNGVYSLTARNNHEKVIKKISIVK